MSTAIKYTFSVSQFLFFPWWDIFNSVISAPAAYLGSLLLLCVVPSLDMGYALDICFKISWLESYMVPQGNSVIKDKPQVSPPRHFKLTHS